jgi:biopolymer transport protein ExbB
MIGDLSVLDLFRTSITMVVLLACSIVTVGFAVERWLFFGRSSTNAKSFMKNIHGKLKSGNVSGARAFCEQQKSAVARVIGQGLAHAHLRRNDLQQRMNTAIEIEQVEMERNLNVLGTMSNIAPLLGLFGTVVGIIRAFAAIARSGSGGSQVVAMGVAEALMTTAAGIIVAVIATVFFNIFIRRIRTRTVDLEDAREELLVLLAEAAIQQQRATNPAPALRNTVRPAVEQEPATSGILS